jgi:hypothetical protein
VSFFGDTSSETTDKDDGFHATFPVIL